MARRRDAVVELAIAEATLFAEVSGVPFALRASMRCRTLLSDTLDGDLAMLAAAMSDRARS